MSQQGLKQASIRAVTGSAETYEGDWHRLFTLAGIAEGNTDATGVFRPATFNERMLLWINQKLSASHTNLPEAQQALAASNGAYNFASMGTFSASSGGGGPAWLTSVTVLGDITVDNTGTPDVLYPANGWMLRIATNQPTLSYASIDGTAVVMTVRDYAYENKVPVTKTRIIRGTGRLGKSYPDSTAFTDADQSAGVMEITLDDWLYNASATDATGRVYRSEIVMISFGEGFFTVSGVPSAAGVYLGTSATRLDSKEYPKPIGCQIEAPNKVTDTGTLRLNWQFIHRYAQGGKQVDCVEAWGRVGGVDGPVTSVTEMTELEYTAGLTSPSGFTASTFTTDIDLSGFSNGDVGIRSRVYPNIGPAIDSWATGVGHDWSTKQAVGWFAEYPAIKDTGNVLYPKYRAWVNQDGTGLTGSDISGVSTSTSDPGGALSYNGLAAAILALQNKRVDGGLTGADGGIVELRDVSGSMGDSATAYSIQTAPSATITKVPVTIRAAAGSASANCRLRGVTSAGASIAKANKTISGLKKVRFETLTFDSTSTADSDDGIVVMFQESSVSSSSPTSLASYYWYEFVGCVARPHAATSSAKPLSGMLINYVTNSDLENCGFRAGFSVWAGTASFVGSKATGVALLGGDVSCKIDCVMTVASTVNGGVLQIGQDDTNPGVSTVRTYVYYNGRMDTTTTLAPAFGIGSGHARSSEMIGIGVCGAIWGRYGDTNSNALCYPAGDDSTVSFENWVFQHISPGGAGGYANQSAHRFNIGYQERGYVYLRKELTITSCAITRNSSKNSYFNDGAVNPLPSSHDSGRTYWRGQCVFDPATGGGTVLTGATVYQANAASIPPGTALSNTAYWFNCGAPGAVNVGPQPRRTGNLEWRNGVGSKFNSNGGGIQSEGDHSVGSDDSFWMSEKRFPYSGTNVDGSKWGYSDIDGRYEDDRTGISQQANIGLGSFRPTVDGDLFGQRPAGYAVDTLDMLGTPRNNDIAGASGALEVIPDPTPNAFSFTDQTGVDEDTVCTSAAVTIEGYNVPIAITVSGGEYNIDGGAFTSSAGTLQPPSAQVRARVTSGTGFEVVSDATVTAGGVSDTFTVTTAAAGSVPSILVAPAITGMNPLGTATPNAALTCSTGTWAGSPSSYAYQWKLAGANVGTNSNTYTPTDVSDAAKAITCEVTATNGNGDSTPAASNSVNTFNPSQLSPIAVFDAEKTSQLALTGANVTSWTADGSATLVPTDLSGTIAQPQYSATGFNGRPGVTGNGTTQYLEVTTGIAGMPTGATPCEIWAIINQPDADSVTNARFIGGWAAISTNDQRARSLYKERFTNGSVLVSALTASVGKGTSADYARLAPAASGFIGRHIARGIYTGTTVTAEIDGVAGTPISAVPNTTAARFRLFANPTNNGGGPVQHFSNATINAFMVLPILTSDQQTALYAWCNARKA